MLLVGIRPSVVVGWLYYGAVVASVAQIIRLPVVWSLHAADFSLDTSFKVGTRLAMRLCRLLSIYAPAIIHYCSDASRITHERLGFPVEKSTVIENAVDVEWMTDALAMRSPSVKMEDFGITRTAGTKLICCVARFEAQKDHRTLMEAAVNCPFIGIKDCIDGERAVGVSLARVIITCLGGSG
jgi:hypothetical protein